MKTLSTPDARLRRAVALALCAMVAPVQVAADQAAAVPTAEPSAPQDAGIAAAAQALLPLLRGEGDPLNVFSPNFLNAVPPEQVAALFAQMRNQQGAPQRIISITPLAGSIGRAMLIIGYERAQVHFQLFAEPGGRIAGLRVTNITTANDSIARLTADLAQLPGTVAWGLYSVDARGSTTLVAGANTGRDMAVGSSFKLAILATLDDQIRHHHMRWSDVVRIDRRSVSTSEIARWPIGSPLTLHTLATLMISQSDNSATDILLHHLGRERVETFACGHGGLSGPNAFPLLSTIEATALKNPALGDVRNRWLTGDEAQRRALLIEAQAQFTPEHVDFAVFNDGPADIDRIEWFASPDALARLFGWFAADGSEEARAILAINPGIPTDSAARWAYVGYKGGSEPGVMAMNLLLRDTAGRSHIVAMAWNNDNAAVDEAAFITLVNRATDLLRAQ